LTCSIHMIYFFIFHTNRVSYLVGGGFGGKQ
jgi:hypothetical protein